MKTVFIYPKSRGTKDNPGNQYINNFVESYNGNGNYKVVDYCVTGKESLDFVFNCSAQLLIFSWIENLVFSKSGKLQFLIDIIILYICRLIGKDIVWVFHNKHPHKGNTPFSRFAMKTMAKVSTNVITHSSYGVNIFNELYPNQRNKCVYIPHPVYNTSIIDTKEIQWDYIIWGEISERKGIVEFLEYVRTSGFYCDKKILICGLCKDDNYALLINKYCNERISFVNRFVFDNELEDWISQSKYILFTYSSDSVLSSGALIYSLNFCKPIIGPNVGNFADMKGIVSCYNTFADIEKLTLDIDPKLCKCYIQDNQWKNMPKKIDEILKDNYESN